MFVIIIVLFLYFSYLSKLLFSSFCLDVKCKHCLLLFGFSYKLMAALSISIKVRTSSEGFDPFASDIDISVYERYLSLQTISQLTNDQSIKVVR